MLKRIVAWALLLLNTSVVGAEDSPLVLSDPDKALLKLHLAMPSNQPTGEAESQNKWREHRVTELFKSAGAADSSITYQQVYRYSDSNLERGERRPTETVRNVLAVLPGRNTEAYIVVGAHLDKIPDRGSARVGGFIDDWSGVVAVTNLYRHLKARRQLEHTILFVCFAYEESGLWGSRSFVFEHYADRLSKIKAMVNLECLGVNQVFSWQEGSSQSLVELADQVATSTTKVPYRNRSIVGVGADSVPFFNQGIPAVTFDSLRNPEDFHLIHSPDDSYAGISDDRYFDAYRFAYDYVVALDQSAQRIWTPQKDSLRSTPLPYRAFAPLQATTGGESASARDETFREASDFAGVRINDNVVALRDGSGWIIVALKGEEARRTPVDQITTSGFGTGIFPD